MFLFTVCVLGVSGGSVVKNPPAKAGDARHTGSIPGSGSFPVERNSNSLQYLAWRIPWTEEPAGLQSTGSQGSDNDQARCTQHTRVFLLSL